MLFLMKLFRVQHLTWQLILRRYNPSNIQTVEIRDGIMIENVGANENKNDKLTYAYVVQKNYMMSETPMKRTVNFAVHTKIEAVGTPGAVSLGEKVAKSETFNLLTILK